MSKRNVFFMFHRLWNCVIFHSQRRTMPEFPNLCPHQFREIRKAMNITRNILQ